MPHGQQQSQIVLLTPHQDGAKQDGTKQGHVSSQTNLETIILYSWHSTKQFQIRKAPNFSISSINWIESISTLSKVLTAFFAKQPNSQFHGDKLHYCFSASYVKFFYCPNVSKTPSHDRKCGDWETGKQHPSIHCTENTLIPSDPRIEQFFRKLGTAGCKYYWTFTSEINLSHVHFLNPNQKFKFMLHWSS